MPPYKELYPVGTKVRVASRAKLDDFLRTWKFHHPLVPEQLLAADRVAEVVNVGIYHGGDVLYGLRDVPGTWHEECLRPEWLEHFRMETGDFRKLEPSETELVGQWVPVGKRVMGDVIERLAHSKDNSESWVVIRVAGKCSSSTRPMGGIGN